MTRLVPRLALIGASVVGASGLVAGPAYAANNYVTSPTVSGVKSLTPESAVLTGTIDTGGNPGVPFQASPSAPAYYAGRTITSPGIVDGIPVGQGFFSTALLEADPMSDYVASGNQPGADTVTAQVVEVPTTTGLSAVSAEIGAYPAASATDASPLTPGTKYVYWLVQQAGENDQAMTVNEYDTNDLAAWSNGSGSITAAGFATSSSVSSSNDYTAWSQGTGSFASDPTDPTRIPGSLINPDYACVLNSAIQANTNPDWTSELAAGMDPTSAGSTSLNGTPLPYGISSASTNGAFTATAKQEPAEQGPCVAFYGGNSTNFYTSQFGSFTTPKLGKIVVAGKGTVSHRDAILTIKDESVERAAGTIVLTARHAGKVITVASGKFSVASGKAGTAKLELTHAGSSLWAKSTKLVTRVTVTSTTDQPSPSKTVTLR